MLAAGFSLAPSIARAGNASGHAALERSWRLLRGHWGAALRMWRLIVVFSGVGSGRRPASAGSLALVVSALVRISSIRCRSTGLVLVYRDAAQYMRRISAPG